MCDRILPGDFVLLYSFIVSSLFENADLYRVQQVIFGKLVEFLCIEIEFFEFANVVDFQTSLL